MILNSLTVWGIFNFSKVLAISSEKGAHLYVIIKPLKPFFMVFFKILLKKIFQCASNIWELGVLLTYVMIHYWIAIQKGQTKFIYNKQTVCPKLCCVCGENRCF